MKAKWYHGIPPVEAVVAHETDHPRRDGVKLSDISVSAEGDTRDSFRHYYVPCNPTSWGNWVVVYPNSPFEGSLNLEKLKVVDDVIYEQVGHTTWHPLAEKIEHWKWAKGARFFPVGNDGLPVGFEDNDGGRTRIGNTPEHDTDEDWDEEE